METVLYESVLIGSRAVQHYGLLVEDANDWDLVASLSDAKELSWLATSKAGPRTLLFRDDKEPQLKKKSTGASDSEHVVDLMVTTDVDCSDGRRTLFSFFDEHVDSRTLDQTIIPGGSTVWVAPAMWLCALYRGHVHRIPQVSQGQEQNVDIWCKYMRRFHTLRSHLGYKKFDAAVQTVGSHEHRIFQSEFDYVNKKLGDAVSLKDKPEDTFFEDNVKRYIDHDELHLRVAKMNRGVAEPLFRRFQLGDGSVEMDQTLFMQASPQDRLDTLKEEIMVLFLERKAIPTAAEHGTIVAFGEERLRPASLKTLEAPYGTVSPDNYEYNPEDENDQHANEDRPDTADADFRSIVCHFMTNLCGTGDSWLRRYALDHWPMLSDLQLYPLEKLCKFANSFRREAFLKDTTNPVATVDDFIKYVLAYNRNDEDGNDEDGNEKDGNEKDGNNEDGVGEDDDICEAILKHVDNVKALGVSEKEDAFKWSPVYMPEEGWQKSSAVVSKEDWARVPRNVLDLLSVYFVTPTTTPSRPSKLYLYPADIIVNLRYGVGFALDTHNITLYFVEVSHGDRVVFGTHKLVVPLADAAEPSSPTYACAKSTFKVQYRSTSYYKSTCDGGYDKEVERKFLNKYGRCFGELECMYEQIARVLQYLDEDERSFASDY